MNRLETSWAQAPMFGDEKYDPAKKPVVVQKGVMKIYNYDSDNRIQIIPLKNVEFIDRICHHLTFHMKSGQRHTIYVGEFNDMSMDQVILDEYAKYCRDE